jgi:hypothetical protein
MAHVAKSRAAPGGPYYRSSTIQGVGKPARWARSSLGQIDEPILLFPVKLPDSSEWRTWARLNFSHRIPITIPMLSREISTAMVRQILPLS